MLRAQCQCIYPLPSPYSSETFQGVPLDSLGVSAIEIGCNYAPDRCQCRQEAPKRILAMLAVFLHFFIIFLRREGVGGGLCSFQVLFCGWGTLKDKIHTGGQKPPSVSTDSPPPTAMKHPRESHWTPWGSAPSKSGT
jgi:hypothetical protein